MSDWHTRPVDQVLEALATDAVRGLDEDEARARLDAHGPNELVERGGKGALRILGEQFTSTMVLILVAAAVASGFLGKPTETIAISAIVVLFALLGFVQEYRAERAMAALKQLAVPVVRVRRDGAVRELPARELVPGDVVLLEAGNLVPADARVIESASLRVQEAALTGESEAVEKSAEPVTGVEVPLGDRRDMVHLGTVVTFGRGTAVVTGTGMSTELGRIATLIQSVSAETTPLQRRLDQVGKLLALAGVVVAALVLGIGVARGEPVEEMFLTAVSVAVAVVPEGLPAVVTISLALGSQRMLRRHALIRKLPAVETLGSVTVIASDKTGTLTVNRMTVTVIDVAGHRLELAAPPAPGLPPRDGDAPGRPVPLDLALAAGALANDASLRADPETGRLQAVGDPTEGALLVAAGQAGLTREGLEAAVPRVAELPFDADRKRMTTVHCLPDGPDGLPPALRGLRDLRTARVAFTKGAVDGLLDRAGAVWTEGGPTPLDEGWRRRIRTASDQLAADGMRVLGLAVRPADGVDVTPDALERDLVFLGLVAMIDPPRPEVEAAVRTCRQAGIRPLMITGDHPLTARFIAEELGIADSARVLTGQDLDRTGADELSACVEEVSVFARVSPEHKLRIVEALQQRGHVVAMTGDGVNDAPALRKADIGVAMGITGTDVSKEAADMVLVDDNFATIVAAVEEGRVIYDNIRRFVKFSLAGNLGKVIVMLLAPLVLGVSVALLPLQLLWLNLLTDGLLGLGMGVEPPEPGVMTRPPRSPRASLFAGGLGWHVAWVGSLIGVVALAVGSAFVAAGAASWQTSIFTTLAFLQVGQALASRSAEASFLQTGPLSNPWMGVTVAAVCALQLAVVYVPFLDAFFEVTPLLPAELGTAAAAALVPFAAIEVEKWLLRRRHRPRAPHTS